MSASFMFGSRVMISRGYCCVGSVGKVNFELRNSKCPRAVGSEREIYAIYRARGEPRNIGEELMFSALSSVVRGDAGVTIEMSENGESGLDNSLNSSGPHLLSGYADGLKRM